MYRGGVSSRESHLIQIVFQVSQKTDVEGGNPLLVHYSLAFEERSTQLLKLLQTFCHVSDLHGIADGLDEVGQFFKPAGGREADVKHSRTDPTQAGQRLSWCGGSPGTLTSCPWHCGPPSWCPPHRHLATETCEEERHRNGHSGKVLSGDGVDVLSAERGGGGGGAYCLVKVVPVGLGVISSADEDSSDSLSDPVAKKRDIVEVFSNLGKRESRTLVYTLSKKL